MSGAALAIPLVDVTSLRRDPVAGGSEAVGAIGRACRESGFFVVVGHGLDRSLASAFAQAERFFTADPSVREACAMVDDRGWAGRGSSRAGDKELYDQSPGSEVRWPDLPGFRRALEAYEADVLALAHDVLAGVARSLDLDAGFFAERMRSPECVLRLLDYPAQPATEAGETTGAHTDYGVITLLATDGEPGLEIRRGDGAWTAVDVPAGAYVVNLGDLLARWTNDRYVSTPHRVVSRTGAPRRSIPFFVNTDPDVVVSAVEPCVDDDRPARHEPIRAGDFLRGRIDGTIPGP